MSSVLGQRISYRSSAALLAVSVGVAYLSAKVTISPLTLLLLSPIGLIGSAVVFVGLDLWLSWAVERQVAARQVSGRASPTIWNKQSTTTTSTSIRNQSRTVPPLIFTSPAAWSVTQTRAAWEANLSAASPSQWPGATEALSNQLNSLLALISRDFVQSWYSRISNSPAFPAAVDSTIQSALIAVATRAGAVDWSTVLVNRLLPLITDHFSAFRTAELALRGQDLKIPLTESAELDLFLAKRYAAESSRGKLHPAVDVASPNSRPAEETWLSNLFGVVVPLILPEKEGESAAVRIMVREIVACAVMVPVVETLSDPDFYNRIIDDKAGAAIRDQKMVTQFREALDKQGDNLTGMSPAGRQGTIRRARTLSRPTEEISVRTTPRQFDAFLRGIDKCKNLLDAKRLRSDVAGQIRKAKAAVGDRAGEEVVDGVKVSVLTSHIERLYGAKTRADERIARLGGVQSKSRMSVGGEPEHARPRVSLREILLQPSSLSYFMEYQERRKRSLPVQFWCLVEGLKDPLDDGNLDGDLTTPIPEPTPAAIATSKSDLFLLWDAYFSTNTLGLNSKHLRVVKAFVVGSSAPDGTPTPPPTAVTGAQLRAVRRAVFAAQGDVLAEMEEDDYPGFVQSDLYFNALADLPDTGDTPPLPSSAVFSPPPLEQTPRQRAVSHPDQNTPLAGWSSPAQSSTDLVKSTVTAAPPPLLSPKIPLGLQRTETAPPQVTFRAVFDQQRPLAAGRKADPDATNARLQPSRKPSTSSLDSFLPPSSAAASKRRSTPVAANSLEFLFSSATDEAEPSLRPALFGDDAEGTEPDEDERQLYGRRVSEGLEDEEEYVQVQTIETIQEALNSILATDAKGTASNGRQSMTSSLTLDPTNRRRSSTELGGSAKALVKPPLKSTPSSLGVYGERIPSGSSTKSAPEPGRRRKAVFDDDDELDLSDLEPEDLNPAFDPQSIKLAAPGDLDLTTEIDRLGDQVEKLKHQEAVVSALIRKAELTGIASELKILTKSRKSLRREMRGLEFQKGQYEAQEEENQLEPGRTTVSISGTTVGQAEGQSFQLFLVEVHQLATDGSYGSGWIVTRRYSEFDSLHTKLRDKYLAARKLEFPAKRLVSSLSNDLFTEQRKQGLEKYLTALVTIPSVCQSTELRAFLSQQNINLPKPDTDPAKSSLALFPGQSLVRSIFRTVTTGIDDALGAAPSSMMDTVIRQLSLQAEQFTGLGMIGGVGEEDLVRSGTGGKVEDGAVAAKPVGGQAGLEEGLTYFTTPICDLFVTLFELKEKNNWLRKQAILIILQQVLGGTIERKFRDGVKALMGPDQLVNYVSALKNALWPGGERRPPSEPRTEADKAATRDSASRKLSALMPDLAANLIGRHNARQGARRLFAVLQNRRLNKHLIYSIVDVVMSELFPELAQVPRARPLPNQFGPRPGI